MFYEVKGEKFIVDPKLPKNRYRSGLEALAAAIRFAKECAQNEDVEVFKDDGTPAFKVRKQGPRPPRSRKEGWNG